MARSACAALLAASLVTGCAGGLASSPPTPRSSDNPDAGATSSPPIPSATRPTFTPTASLEARLDRVLAVDFNGSALVAKDGQVLYAKGIGYADRAKDQRNAPDTRFRLGSITKQFTAMGVLMLESRGLVGLDDAACGFLDVCPPGWDAITIGHLVSHTSGIANYTDLPDLEQWGPLTPAEIVAKVEDIPLAGRPGDSFAYSNTGYVLLGMIIERVSGMSYEEFLEDGIFEPLGMRDSGYDHGDRGVAQGYRVAFVPADAIDMSVPYAAGALYSTVLDLQRWDAALSAAELVPAADMIRYFRPLAADTGLGGLGYAYGLFVGQEDGHEIQAHGGAINGFSTFMARYPDDGVLVVLLANREMGGLEIIASTAARLVRGG